MPSPVRHIQHGKPHFNLITWMGGYVVATQVVEGSDNATSRLDVINEPQPDSLIFILPQFGGQVRISTDGYIEHAPEFVAEVAASSKGLDAGEKKDVYCRNEVREYLIWRTEDRVIDWFVLREDKFEALQPGPDGVLRSEALPGFWLDPAALVAEDMRRVMLVLRRARQPGTRRLLGASLPLFRLKPPKTSPVAPALRRPAEPASIAGPVPRAAPAFASRSAPPGCVGNC